MHLLCVFLLIGEQSMIGVVADRMVLVVGALALWPWRENRREEWTGVGGPGAVGKMVMPMAEE